MTTRSYLLALAGTLALSSCVPGAQVPATDVFELPEGYRIEQIAGGLTYPTSVTWDDAGTLYVAEAGGGLNPEQLAPSRILRVENGQTQELVNLTDRGVFASVVGLTFSGGNFFITHRNQEDLTGAVSRVSMSGEVAELFSGILDSQSEHQINDIRVGPDGRLYVAVGPAGNSGVIDDSVAPWVMESPNLHTTPCQDIVLTGRNFQTPDFRTMDDPDDMVLTGAYVPFGTETTPGQVVPGTNKCGGSVLAFDPEDAEATLEVYAWGFRNLIGLAWDAAGTLYAAENGYDVRGSRPVQDAFDATLRVQEGVWYGVPDFSAGREPLTNPSFEPPDDFQAEVFVNGESQGKTLGFLIDHEASGLTAPDPSLVVGRHPWSSSPSMLDVAPASWGEFAGDLFVAEWGDLAPPTNPLLGEEPAGYRVARIDLESGQLEPFVSNAAPGPASGQGAAGRGVERPFDVQFGPDGAMYIVDYGVVEIDMSLIDQGRPPYSYQEGTGAVWRVTRAQ